MAACGRAAHKRCPDGVLGPQGAVPAPKAALPAPSVLPIRMQKDFLAVYFAGMSVLRTTRDFEQLADAYLARAAAQGVRHVELFFDPQAHLERWVAAACCCHSCLPAAGLAAAGMAALGLQAQARHGGGAASNARIVWACKEDMPAVLQSPTGHPSE